MKKDFQLGSWLIQPDNNKLVLGDEEFIVEPLMMEVLYYFATHPKQVISRDELVEQVWKGRVVGDHAVYRIINQLRKILGKDTETLYIETIRKKGYQLSADIEWPQAEHQEDLKNGDAVFAASAIKPEQNKNKKKALLVTFSLLLFALISFMAIKIIKYQSITVFTSSSPLRVFDGQVQDPVYSPDGKNLAFSYKSSSSKGWNITIESFKSGNLIEFTDSFSNHYSPSWSPDGENLAFIKQDDYSCEIVIKSFNDKGKDDVALTECLGGIGVNDLAWSKDGKHIYYTSANKETGPLDLYRINIRTGKKEQLTNEPEGVSRGYLKISLSPDGNWLALLKDKNWKDATLSLQSLNSDKKIVVTTFVGGNRHLAWSNDSELLFYSANSKSLNAYSIDGDYHKRVVNNIEPISYPAVSPVKDELIVVTGRKIISIWNSTIDALTQQVGQDKVLTESGSIDERAEFANTSNDFAFISRRKGIPQIWIKKEHGEEIQLSRFSDYLSIYRLRWSPDDSKIIFQGGDSLFSIDTSDSEIEKIIDKEQWGAVEAHNWSNDGMSIYFSSHKDGDWQIYRFSVNNKNIEKITETGGYAAIEATDNSIFYLKYHQPGLWRFNLVDSKESKVVDNIDVFSNNAVRVINNHIYYLSSDYPNYKLYQYDIDKEQQQKIADFPSSSKQFSISRDGINIMYQMEMKTNASLILLRP